MSESEVPAPSPGPTPATGVPGAKGASPANLARKSPARRQVADPRGFGRVGEDGTVYVRVGEDERAVGQVPDVTAEEALTFFVRRYEALALEVQLLSTRITNGTVNPDEGRKAVNALRRNIDEAHAVGDLPALLAQLEALTPTLDQAQQVRRDEREKTAAQARERKEQMVGEAEKLAAGTDWRGGVNRFRALLDEWRALPRVDRQTDDALWHRFSTARSTYTKRRKAQFSQQAKQRDEAKTVKERIIAEAEALASSTEWGPTAGAFRELMNRWKAAGPAPREVDDKLWARFRGIQDEFFGARNAELDKQNEEFQANQVAKEALLDEYEPRVRPDEDLQASRAAFREFLDRWSELGKVPREAIKPLDARVKAMERSLSTVERAEWKRTDPEARARAQDTAAKLTAQINELDDKAAKAQARGDLAAAKKAQESAETYRTWLEQAERAVQDFSA